MSNYNYRTPPPHFYPPPHSSLPRNSQNNVRYNNMYPHYYYNQQQFRPHNQHNNIPRQNTYNADVNNAYLPHNNVQRGNKRKDSFNENSHQKTKPKRNKTLGRHNPTKANFTQEDVEKALRVEKEYLKDDNNVALMVRLPDPEINKDIVQKIHPAFKDISFALCPSNARSFYVTLKDNANGDKTIDELNKTKFAQGYLTAEYKQAIKNDIHNNDIDPLRLFVGNLSKDITKHDVLSIFPEQHRVDIGFSRKHANTRYAKVQFKNVDQAIEAFKRNVKREVHGKSLILRFYRFSEEDDKDDGTENGVGGRKEPNLNSPGGNSTVSSVASDGNLSSKGKSDLQSCSKGSGSTNEPYENGLSIKQEPHSDDDDIYVINSNIDPLKYSLNYVKNENF